MTATQKPHKGCMKVTQPTHEGLTMGCMWDHQFRWNSHPTHNDLTFASHHTYKGHMVPLQAAGENMGISWPEWGGGCTAPAYMRWPSCGFTCACGYHVANVQPLWGTCGRPSLMSHMLAARKCNHAITSLNWVGPPTMVAFHTVRSSIAFRSCLLVLECLHGWFDVLLSVIAHVQAAITISLSQAHQQSWEYCIKIAPRQENYFISNKNLVLQRWITATWCICVQTFKI